MEHDPEPRRRSARPRSLAEILNCEYIYDPLLNAFVRKKRRERWPAPKASKTAPDQT